ncbi:DUF1573 domain-containing protein [Ferruginibacter sp. SUN002]|uniref:DUF1573 domain-containing protein n=1 Tax=Ferruginibacter sp. SUN002 TaxID=2937789 RepID=UPI003D35CB22
MKKGIVFLLLLTAIFSCNIRRKDKISDEQATAIEKASKDTTTVQLIDSVFDFGTITEGEKVSFSFRFKNTGTKALVIEKTSASCGCTVPEKPEKPILPGEIGFIKAVFTPSSAGHNEKTIDVTANTKPDFPTLILTGEVAGKKE